MIGTFHFSGCSIDVSFANNFITSPSTNTIGFPPAITCDYTIRAPAGERRQFKMKFDEYNLADAQDTVEVSHEVDTWLRTTLIVV